MDKSIQATIKAEARATEADEDAYYIRVLLKGDDSALSALGVAVLEALEKECGLSVAMWCIQEFTKTKAEKSVTHD
jgi:hypothetical protein